MYGRRAVLLPREFPGDDASSLADEVMDAKGGLPHGETNWVWTVGGGNSVECWPRERTVGDGSFISAKRFPQRKRLARVKQRGAAGLRRRSYRRTRPCFRPGKTGYRSGLDQCLRDGHVIGTSPRHAQS